MGNLIWRDHGRRARTRPADNNRYDTLNVDGLIDGRADIFKSPESYGREDFIEWIRASALDPIEDFLVLRHSVCKGMLEVVSVLYVPVRTCTDDDLAFGDIQFYDRIHPALQDVELLPPYLKFVSGLVVAQTPLPTEKEARVNYIEALRKKLLEQAKSMLQEASERPDVWKAIWLNFATHIKHGACADVTKSMASLLRYATSLNPKRGSSLASYVSRMPPRQRKIYFARGHSFPMMLRNPCIERLVSSGKEVLFMTDPIDDFVISTLKEFAGHPLHSATAYDRVNYAKSDRPFKDKTRELRHFMNKVLEGKIRGVRVSTRLLRHPCCLITKGIEPTRTPLCQQAAQAAGARVCNMFRPERDLVLDVNPHHHIIKALKTRVVTDQSDVRELLRDIVVMLYNTSLLCSGFGVDGDYQSRVWSLMEKLNRV